ncbi:MAG: peptide chain release factor 1 [SAR202 cluster bacterium]|nr:peptide chain release factor 1 [Chloroflexota bacterium]MCS5656619.1 peptide chain release factor 1 [Dehalococcoidia bacterium]MQG49884.1 peptide chain release factor 1 [SAR202 cluster bacterium]MBU17623.1 peptide chain release factor 1 [Chloroflexota bacterium]MEE3006100.1 peptide chain release factor 1 [Chloroflexota bacterium]|tara:strand:- start:1125 stop:2204 length:1080 start_codon:yes stop_codon:yes gene_type:complete
MSTIFDKLEPVIQRYHEIEESMGDPEVAANFERIQELARERASLETLVKISSVYKELVGEIEDLESLLKEGSDPELIEMAKEELDIAQGKFDELTQDLRLALLPKNPNDERDVIMEIRAGAGGAEAGIFAADLYRAYSRYAVNQGWKVEVMDSNPTEVGGFNKIVFEVQGKGVFSRMKFESGVHRVQRVPNTETQGRIHTSTATVAVLPVVDEVEVKIDPNELRIDIFHAGGHGGQNVNKVATAVRIVHEPSGLTVVCQDERSQHKNKQRAMTMLRSRLFEAEQMRHDAEISEARRSQVGQADRSEKIRTYNYPQDRITDHRSNENFHGIPRLMDGGLGDMFDRLSVWEQERLLADATA